MVDQMSFRTLLALTAILQAVAHDSQGMGLGQLATKDPTVMCFARLRPKPKRTKEDVMALLDQWTAASEEKQVPLASHAVDRNNVVLTAWTQEDALKGKDFLLEQEEVHEVECGKEVFRRSGDQPLEEVKRQRAAEAQKSKWGRMRQAMKNLWRRKQGGRRRTSGQLPTGQRHRARQRIAGSKKQEL